MCVRVCVIAVMCVLLRVTPSLAQPPTAAPAVQPWKLNFGAGLALTSGNKDTSTYNASYKVVYAPNTRRRFKSDALLLRGRSGGELSHDRFGLNIREELQLNERIFLFGQSEYLRDRFKNIQYLVAPTAGVGVTTVDNERTTLTIDVGLGGVWEKNPFTQVRSSGALTLSQELTQTISHTTTLTQSISGLWKTEDLNDAYYQLGVAVALGINSKVQLKLEALNTYSSRPTGRRVEKNDLSTVIAIVFKN